MHQFVLAFVAVALAVQLFMWILILIPVYLTHPKDCNAEAGLLNRAVFCQLPGPLKQDQREVVYASYWLSRLGFWILRWLQLHTCFSWQRELLQSVMLLKDRRCGGIMSYRCWRANVMEEIFLRHISKETKNTAEKKGLQVVILGAGWDSRAYRFAAEREANGVSVFEVDLPDIQISKRRALERMCHDKVLDCRELAGVTFLTCDLEKEDIGVALKNAGFTARRPALVICEGVFIYLTDAAVRKMVRSLGEVMTQSNTTTTNSMHLAFDYQLDHSSRHAGGKNFDDAWRSEGNPQGMFYEPAHIPDLLQVGNFHFLNEWNSRTEAWRFPSAFREAWDVGRVVFATHV